RAVLRRGEQDQKYRRHRAELGSELAQKMMPAVGLHHGRLLGQQECVVADVRERGAEAVPAREKADDDEDSRRPDIRQKLHTCPSPSMARHHHKLGARARSRHRVPDGAPARIRRPLGWHDAAGVLRTVWTGTLLDAESISSSGQPILVANVECFVLSPSWRRTMTKDRTPAAPARRRPPLAVPQVSARTLALLFASAMLAAGAADAQGRRAARAGAFARADKDGDGYLSGSEVEALVGARGDAQRVRRGGLAGGTARRRMADVEERVRRLAAGDGGRISEAEFIEARNPLLERFDADGDGAISREEVDRAQQRMRAQAQRRRAL